MKSKIIFATCFFLTLSFFAQKTIEASDVMKNIKEGKDISYQNTTIVGTLDFTYMDETLEKLPKKKKNSWWNNDTSNLIKKVIKANISFTNCVFKDDVLAYIPDEDSGYTFTADFDNNIIFKHCTFQGKAMFKYSHFKEYTDFTGTIFNDDNTFKRAEFKKAISFKSTKFTERATFKYAKFSKNVSFANSIFEDSAVFKYTKFNNGVSFNHANFEEDLNIKYMEVLGEFDITKMNVGYDIDSKYTKINGKSFNKYLLISKN